MFWANNLRKIISQNMYIKMYFTFMHDINLIIISTESMCNKSLLLITVSIHSIYTYTMADLKSEYTSDLDF